MSRADDIKTVARLIPRIGMGWAPERDDECAAIQRVLPDAIAALRFVEEHSETLEAVLVDATSHREDYFKCEREALEALRRLTAEQGES